MPPKRSSNALLSSAGFAILVPLSVLFRAAKLGEIPGFNGDEAWGMVQAHRIFSDGALLARTPSHRILTPTYLLMSAAVSRLASPSVAMARLPALICGLALVLLAFFLATRMFGKRIGLGAFALVSSSPALIAFSRIGWEPSQVPLASLLAFYFCWTENPIPLVLTLIIGALIHPTFVFLAPALCLPMFASFVSRSKFPTRLKSFLLAVDLWAAGALFIYFVAQPNAHRVDLSGSPIAGTWLTTLIRSGWNLGQLFSGVTVYEDFIAPVPGIAGGLLGALSLIVLILSGVGLFRRAKKEASVKWIARGYALSLFSFLTIGGPIGLYPGFERWALFLVVPGILLIGLGLAELLPHEKSGGSYHWACLGLNALLLAGFAQYYFRAEMKDGALSHPTYSTGPAEPKTAAFAQILADSKQKGLKSVLIVADEWWNYWPIRYFALPYPEIDVALVIGDPSRLRKSYDEGAYLVGFPAGAICKELSKEEGDPRALRYDYASFGGKTILQLWTRR